MLNELTMLGSSLAKSGISSKDWDKNFKEIKLGASCFVVSLDDQAQITHVRFIDKDKVKFLRTWQGGSNGDTFPAFNFTPIFKFPDDWTKKNSKFKSEVPALISHALESIAKGEFLANPNEPVWCGDKSEGEKLSSDRCFDEAHGLSSKADKKSAKCLEEIRKQFEQKISAKLPPDSPVLKLCQTIGLLGETPDAIVSSFNLRLLVYLLKFIPQIDVSHKEKGSLLELLLAKDDVVLFFDLDCSTGETVACEHQMELINRALIENVGESRVTSNALIDAFGFSVGEKELEEKLPAVKLPGIPDTKLRSMSGESACQMRYGKIDAISFPVGSSVRKTSKAALEWICAEEREGLTWSKVSSDEIVFAYPRSLPAVPPMLARLLGNGENADARFAECAKRTIESLKGYRSARNQAVEIEVFAIRKADKARRKVVFYRDYSDVRLRESVSEWEEGSDNLPEINLRAWPDNKTKENREKSTNVPEKIDLHSPYPLNVIPIVYQVWSSDSLSKMTPPFRKQLACKNLPVFDGLELLLAGTEVSSLAQRMLSIVVQNGQHLLVACAGESKKGHVLSSGTISAYVGNVLPIIGILLYKLSIRKDQYMNEMPYQLGKFLKLADGLHQVWFEVEKNGDPLPPVLLGSSMYSLFSQSPVQGMAALGDRLRIYLAWAKTCHGEKAGLARWYLKELGKVSEELSASVLPTRFTDAEKSQMLLGFLAVIRNESEEQEPSRNS